MWRLASGDGAVERRRVVDERARRRGRGAAGAGETGAADAARRAIYDTVVASCSVPLSEALDVQSRHSAEFMTGKACRSGVVGTASAKLQG